MTTNLAGTPAAWPAPRIGATVRTRVPGPVVYARIVAVLAVVLGLVHVWVMVAFPHGPWVAAALGAMVLLCLKCAHRSWGHPAALVELLAMSALMALAHTFMALGVHEHRHGGEGPAATAIAGSGSGAMLGIAAAELALVMLCGIGMRLAANRSAAGTGGTGR